MIETFEGALFLGSTPLEVYKACVSDIMLTFADVRVMSQNDGLETTWRNQDKDTLKAFLRALLEDGQFSINSFTAKRRD